MAVVELLKGQQEMYGTKRQMWTVVIIVVIIVIIAVMNLVTLVAAPIVDDMAPDVAEERQMRVGIRNFDPCIIIDFKSGWTRGFEIELWEEMAKRANVKFEYEFVDFSDIVGTSEKESKIETGEIDVGFGGVTITSDRLERFDSCHSHLSTGLKMVSRKAIKIPYRKLGLALGGLLFIVCLYGHILWFLERGNQLINDNYYPGIFDGMWCIMTTMSTVGYGDISPKKTFGKLFASWVMLTGIGYFCAVISVLSVSSAIDRNACSFSQLNDLRGMTVAVKENATAQKIASNYTSLMILTKTAEEAVSLVESGRVDAALVDAPVVDGMIKKGYRVAASGMLARQDYGIFLRKDDPVRQRLNRSLRTMIEDGTFNEIYNRWF